MGHRIRISTVLIVCISTSLTLTCLVAVLPLTSDSCICQNEDKTPDIKPFRKALEAQHGNGHKLAVIVPFRDRFDELLVFAPHMDSFLSKQDIHHHIFIINQVDQYRFNRASLINAGFLETRHEYDYIVMHDVDLLPLNPALFYDYPDSGPLHIASPDLHPRYHYPTFVGGILLVKKEHFEEVDGMSNKYWGWGLEDDEFYVRLKEAKLNISRPKNILTNTTNTFSHIHEKSHRKRDTVKCYNQRDATRKRDRETGLHNVIYQVTKKHQLTIDDVPVTVLNVKLNCNRELTPWCDCTQQADTSKPAKKQKS